MESTAASSSPASPGHAQWLQITLSDFNGRMKTIVTRLEENFGCLGQQPDMFNNRKTELLQMLEELGRSYRSLATECDTLRSKSQYVRSGSPSLSSSSHEIHLAGDIRKTATAGSDDAEWEASRWNSSVQSVVSDPDDQQGSTNLKYLIKLADDLISTEQSNKNLSLKPDKAIISLSDEVDIASSGKPAVAELRMSDCKWESAWPQLIFKVTKLMAENLRQQAELLRRNDEKRKIINELQLQLEQLKSDNTALQSCLCRSKRGKKQSYYHISKIRRLILGNSSGAGCL